MQHARQQITDDISIHAPREGSDSSNLGGIASSIAISIHAPREGSDPLKKWSA